MDSFVILHNDFYPTSSTILLQNLKNFLSKICINDYQTQQLPLGNKLSFLIGERFYSKILKTLIQIQKEDKQTLICDSQSLIVIVKLIKKLYEEQAFKEALTHSLKEEIDILALERSIKFIPEIVLESFKRDDNPRSWKGFKAAFIIDRELEGFVKQIQFLEKLESILELKILPFYKESYDYLLKINPTLAYKMASSDYYEMVDCGVDFIMTANIGNFEIFDRYSKMIQKTAGRDDLEIPLLFLPQVFLSTFRDSNPTTLLFKEHNIPPKML